MIDGSNEDHEFIPKSPRLSGETTRQAEANAQSENDSKFFLVLVEKQTSLSVLKQLPPESTFSFDCKKTMVSGEDDSKENNGDDEVSVKVMEKLSELQLKVKDDKSLIGVYSHFFDEMFWKLVDNGCRIISPFLVSHSNSIDQVISRMKRHLYTISMRDLVVCFTGFRDKKEVMEMGKLVTAMGGSLRDKMSWRVTHLIALEAVGIKYRCALTYKIPVVSREWIHNSWAQRDEPDCFRAGAAAETVEKYLIHPFHGCKLAFVGFSDSTLSEMVQETERNGGKVMDILDILSDEKPTHVVVHELQVRRTSSNVNFPNNCEIVRSEWFWACLHKRYLERPDAFRISVDVLPNSPKSASNAALEGGNGSNNADNHDTPQRGRRSGIYSTKVQRRSRQAEFNERLIHLAQLSSDSLGSPMQSVIGHDSISYTSILDATGESIGMESEHNETCKSPIQEVKSVTKTPDSTKKRKYTPRYGKVMELIHTESNFVGILECMVSIIRKEILDPNQPGGPILSERDAEMVFHGIVPLLDVHSGLKDDLMKSANNEMWVNDPMGEKIQVGSIMLRHLDVLKRVYPSFVNFYDQRKEAVEELAKKYSRFHAYLRRCQSRKETGRNSIIELMIRPVQRLPSMMLILQDLLKHTDESLPDHAQLSTAVQELKSVLSSINEDKRRTEGFLAVFNVVHSIDGCPADLASSHRQFLAQVDVVEVTDKLVEIGQGLTLFLFSDQLEICRRKKNPNLSRNGSVRNNANTYGDDVSLMSASTVSIPAAVAAASTGHSNMPSTPVPSVAASNASSVGGHGKKKYKHVMLVPLSEVECTTDLRKDIGTDDDYRAFALVLKKKTDDTPRDVYAFAITDDTEKLSFLHMVTQQMLITTCKNITADCLINEMTAGDINIDIEEAFRRHTFSGKARRLRQRVSRVLSFTRTPRKMKRALSQLHPSGGTLDSVSGNLTDVVSPSSLDLRDSAVSIDTAFTPTRSSEVTRSVAALTPNNPKDPLFGRMSACSLQPCGEIFEETRGRDPDSIFKFSPPTPEPPLRGHTGRPSLAMRFQQHFTNVFRRSLSSGSRLSMASTIEEPTIEKKKRARLTTIFGQSGSISRMRLKNSNKQTTNPSNRPPKVTASASLDSDYNPSSDSGQPSGGLRRLRNRAGSLASDSCLLPKLHSVQEFRSNGELNGSDPTPSPRKSETREEESNDTILCENGTVVLDEDGLA